MEGRYISQRLIATNKAARTQVFQVITSKHDTRCLKRQHFGLASERNSAYLLQSLQQPLCHPGIIRVFRSYISEDETGFILETELEWGGTDLEDVTALKSRQKTSWSQIECGQLLESMVSALVYAQKLGICHRDIKPMNIFQNPATSEYKLGDFGCAKSANDLAACHSIAGTPLFLSPLLRTAYFAQISGREDPTVTHDPYKSDVYSLGLTIVYLLKGKAMDYFNRPEETLSEIGKLEVGNGLKEVLKAMLEPKEEQRPSFIQVEEMWKQLKTVPIERPVTGELQRKKPSRLKRVSMSERKECLACSQFFDLGAGEAWRTSIRSKAGDDFCSERCWNRQIELEVPLNLECVECKMADEGLYFLHCGVHFVCVSHHQNSPLKPTATLRQVCPQCPPPTITEKRFAVLSLYTYDSLVSFMKIQKKDGSAQGYYPLHRRIVETWEAKVCHFCGGSLGEFFIYLPHNDVPAFCCRPECLQQHIQPNEENGFCTLCQALIPLKRIKLISNPLKSLVWKSEDLCDLCRISPVITRFLCNDGLCAYCFRASYHCTGPYFSCACCGLVVHQDDYRELLKDLNLL